MAVDGVNESQARMLAQKRKELEIENNNLELAATRVKRETIKAAQAQKEKGDQEMVAISKAGEQQTETLRKINSERLRSLDTNNQKAYLSISQTTADEIKRMEGDSLKAIADHHAGHMEKLRFVTAQAEDPFYRLKSLNPVMTENEQEYRVKVALPEHEAKNLFVSGEGQSLKLSLARRFQEKHQDHEAALTTKTNSYQTVVESLALGAPINSRGIRREYLDGVVTIFVPKAAGPVVMPEIEKV